MPVAAAIGLMGVDEWLQSDTMDWATRMSSDVVQGVGGGRSIQM